MDIRVATDATILEISWHDFILITFLANGGSYTPLKSVSDQPTKTLEALYKAYQLSINH